MVSRLTKSGRKTHDVWAEWEDEDGKYREIVGLRALTNEGECIEILFRRLIPWTIATITAVPII
ncbi:hypothetical protein ACN9JG_22960 (plasmid) [Cereibacter azotoformans]|uniref:hypothetical protein n=1 Tax=Cereibacter azotoformans TaxID=43057 RepID=UPI003B22123C